MTNDNKENYSAAPEESKSPSIVEKFVIRLPNGLRSQIRELSEQNRRSMNSEIIMVLENHIRQNNHEEMASVNEFTTGLDYKATDEELNKRLDSLPAEKKEALLELLG